ISKRHTWRDSSIPRYRALRARNTRSGNLLRDAGVSPRERNRARRQREYGVAMNSFPQDSTILLVHGAWADGSCWRDVILPLERQGLRVICAPIPLTSLSDDASALIRAVERTADPIVLVGHAYGGAVIGVICKERVKSFVYVAALAPDEGETVG